MNEDVCRCVGSWCVYCTKVEARKRIELAACKAKLARVEALADAISIRDVPEDYCRRLNADERSAWLAADLRVESELRAALAGSGEKP